MADTEKEIGFCVGDISTREVGFIGSGNLKLGDYVELFYEGYSVLGFIKSIKSINSQINEGFSVNDVSRLKTITKDKSKFKGTITILGDVKRKMFIPRIPPKPGTIIYKASSKTLEMVFGKDDGKKVWIGNLLTREDVKVFLDIDSMVSRHLAILAITGGGKSNAVSVIIEDMIDKLGSIVVFDMHGEYVDFDYKIRGKECVNKVDLKINPLKLSYREFKQFANVDDSAYVQDRYLRKAFKNTKEAISKGEIKLDEFWGRLNAELKSFKEAFKEDEKSIVGVLNKVEDAEESFAELFDTLQPSITNRIEFSKLNVFDLSSVDERIADIIVSHVLREMLEKRKNSIKQNGKESLDFPVFTIIEEAHILAPSSMNTRSKYWISRIAREGRKFGLGLCLVSQRPKSLDANSLSQVNNMIILKLIEPNDQKHVQQASESLSSDLVEQLPSLNVGEALIMGKMTPIPALVKVRLAKAKRSGRDISAVEQWQAFKSRKEREIQEGDAFLGFGSGND